MPDQKPELPRSWDLLWEEFADGRAKSGEPFMTAIKRAYEAGKNANRKTEKPKPPSFS